MYGLAKRHVRLTGRKLQRFGREDAWILRVSMMRCVAMEMVKIETLIGNLDKLLFEINI